MDVLKRMEKIIRENVFQQKKKKLELKFNPGLVLIGLRTTGPRILNTKKEIEQGVRIVNLHITNLRRVVHLADYAHGNNCQVANSYLTKSKN